MNLIDDSYSDVSNRIGNIRKELETHISQLKDVEKFLVLQISQFFDTCLKSFSDDYDTLNNIQKSYHSQLFLCRSKVNCNNISEEELKKSLEFHGNEVIRSLSVIKEQEKNSLISALDMSCHLFTKLKKKFIDRKSFIDLVYNKNEMSSNSEESLRRDDLISHIEKFKNQNLENVSNTKNKREINEETTILQNLSDNTRNNNNNLKKSDREDLLISNSENNFLKQKRNPQTVEGIILEKMEKQFKRKFDRNDLVKLENRTLNKINFSKKNDKIFNLEEDETIEKVPLSKYVKIKLTSTKSLNFECIEQISIFFKSYIISETKENSKNIYLIGGEIKSTYFVTIFQILKYCIHIRKEYNFEVEIEDCSFLEDVIRDLTPPSLGRK